MLTFSATSLETISSPLSPTRHSPTTPHVSKNSSMLPSHLHFVQVVVQVAVQLVIQMLPILILPTPTFAILDLSAHTNLVAYWGQNSAYYLGSQEQNLSFYCDGLQRDTRHIDALILAFVIQFQDSSGQPVLNLANHCPSFPCLSMTQEILTCQSRGVSILLSLGGSTGSYGFPSSSTAIRFAKVIHYLFFNGQPSPLDPDYSHVISIPKPFGNVVLDGIDLDIEGGSPLYYTDFVSTLRQLSSQHALVIQSSPSRPPPILLLTIAPQCPWPDAMLDSVIQSQFIDAVFIQFYNNYCSLPNHNYDKWNQWAKEVSINPNVKLFLGLPGHVKGAPSGGYSTIDQVSHFLSSIDKTHFGGIMIWDVGLMENNKIGYKTYGQLLKELLIGNL